MSPTHAELLSAYRHLYRSGLRAVQYSSPARYNIRDKLRKSFRTESPENFNPDRIGNTIRFLETAAERRGLEHKIVKNLCLVEYYWGAENRNAEYRAGLRVFGADVVKPLGDGFRECVGLLNQSEGLELR
jgi:hypothetical protein